MDSVAEFQPAFEVYIAGGNMGGDCDQVGKPVVDGFFYVAGGEEVLTVAGPFEDPEVANQEASRLTQIQRHIEAAEVALSAGNYSGLRFAAYDILRLVASRAEALEVLASVKVSGIPDATGHVGEHRLFGPLGA